nr:AAA family ATPase [Yoonia sp.]
MKANLTAAAPDRREAEKFLATLDPSAQQFTFQTFDDNHDRRDKSLAKVFNGTLDQYFDTLAAYSARGAGIFVTINETDLRGREKHNVTRIRAVFVDTDGAPQEPIDAAIPHIVVESSPGKYHDYWLVKDCPIEAFTPYQIKLSEIYGTDDGVKDLPRVLRLPGFVHQKIDSKKGLIGTPFMVKVIDCSTAIFGGDPWLGRAKIIDAAYAAKVPSKPLSEQATAAIQPPSGAGIKIDTGGGYHAATETTPDEAAEIVSWIDADDYHTWIKVLGGLHELGDHMLNVAEEWSARSAKYRVGEVLAKWRTFKPTNGNVWNGVCKLAEAHGANLSEIATKYKGGVEAAPVGTTGMPTTPHAKTVENAVNAQIDNFKSGIFRACDLNGQPVPERVWHVHDLIPANTVTLLSGDGGTGKSLCALQLAASTALQRPWLGLAVRHGKAVYLSAEDDKAELHRRLTDITRAENATLADLGDLTLGSLAGEDALLATVAKGGTLQATPLLEAVKQLLEHDCPDLLVLDTLADYFPGNENDRAQARQFIGMLRGLAINHRCAVVMLAHPSVAGMASGTGTSGSTGWNNSVRSRLYLSRVVQDGYEQNPDARVLRTMKSNYSGIGGEIALTWQNGVFVADAPVTGLDRMAASAKAERVFLALLRMFAEQGRTVNHAGGSTYAPKIFAEHPKSEGMTKRALKAAMDALLMTGKIRIAQSGPPSKRRAHLELAE